VPFYGQGMNCGFEDCAELNALIGRYDHDWERIFPAYERARKPNGDAIAELSKRNFVEMSDLSGDRRFQVRKMIEAKFAGRHPELWTPLYSMVTFSPDVPYSEALRIGDAQNTVMAEIMALPGIEERWDEEHVMDRLLELATATFGDQS
jgi:kynurenine 3-monooxygenase